MSDDSKSIELRVSNNRTYVWDLDDLAALRAEHHICGVLEGTLPHVSQQNVFLGIPLVLLPEEVVLLVENRIAVLVDDPSAHLTPSQDRLKTWNAERIASIQTQLSLGETTEHKEKAMTKSMTPEAIQKRKEREEKRAAAARAKALAEGSAEETVFIPAAIEDDRPSTPASTSTGAKMKTSNVPYTVTVPASSSASLEWYSTKRSVYTTIEAAQDAGIWTYPADLHERAKCGVFRDLWENGHFMGGGIKFGGDFLVYPGDPLRYHSHFVASVIDSPLSSLRPMEIVAHGRLGTATKKSHLLCGWDDEKREVSYYSIEWAGFG